MCSGNINNTSIERLILKKKLEGDVVLLLLYSREIFVESRCLSSGSSLKNQDGMIDKLLTSEMPIVANNILPIEEFTRGAEGVYLLKSTGAKEILEGVLRALTDERTEKLYFKRFSRDQTCETLSTGRALQQWERVTGLKLHTNV